MIRVPEFVSAPDPDIYRRGSYIVLDFETTVKVHGSAVEPDNSLVLACWQFPDGTKKQVLGNEFNMQQLVDDIKSVDFIVAHNAKFELQWLKRCGLHLEDVLVYDTKLAEYVLGGNRYAGFQTGLNQCLERRGMATKIDVMGLMYKAGLCSTDMPESWLIRYCHKDVQVTHDLYKTQLTELSDRLLNVVYARCLLTPVLADIEFNGLAIDVTRVTEMIQEKEREYNELTATLLQEFGTENVNGTIEKQRLFYDELGFDVPRDPRTKKPLLTPTGRPKTDEATLGRLRATNDRQRRFLELFRGQRALHSELTKYLRTFQECGETGGILRGEFHQHRTKTHRLSSSGLDYSIQFQNLPRAYKSLFVPRRKGWLMGEADGSQLEFRVAAHLGRDAVALQHIKDGVDIHSATADIIGVTRQEAKAHTFKPLYGGRSGTTNERNYYQYFRDTYEGVTDAQEGWIEQVLRTKQLETEWGLIYYWPDTKRSRDGYVQNTTSICNYPVQALATAEIIPASLIYMWHTLKRSRYLMMIVNTIHDSVVIELPEEEREAYEELSRICFTEAPYDFMWNLYGVKLTVPLGCEAKAGSAWGAGKDVKYTAEERFYE